MLDESAYRVIRILLEAISTPEPLTTTYLYVDVTANHINVPIKPILNASSNNFLLARPPHCKSHSNAVWPQGKCEGREAGVQKRLQFFFLWLFQCIPVNENRNINQYSF